jgi:molybdenum ABC transporter molybdate-binding protein
VLAGGKTMLAGLVLALGVALALPRAAVAQAAPDVIVYGDPTLRHALLDVGARFTAETGVPVHVFAAPPTLILAQLRHQVWNDVVVTLAPWMDQAEQAGVIEKGTRTGAWRNTLVLARAAGVTPANDTVAVTDPTPAATVDGRAVLAAMELHPLPVGVATGTLLAPLATQGGPATHVQGVANTAEVAFLLDTGAAAQGLVYLTDVRADPELSVAGPVADAAYAPIVYAAAISTLRHSPNAHAFLDYLHAPAATEVLRADGLQTVPPGTVP